MFWVVLVLIVAPFVELYVVVQVADVIGWLNALGLLVLSAIIGISVIRMAFRKWRAAGRAFSAPGAVPPSGPKAVKALADPLLLLIAGILLFLPGFISDVIGLLLLLPPVRSLVLLVVGDRLARRFPPTTSTFTWRSTTQGQVPPTTSPYYTGEVIEGEVVEGEIVEEEDGK